MKGKQKDPHTQKYIYACLRKAKIAAMQEEKINATMINFVNQWLYFVQTQREITTQHSIKRNTCLAHALETPRQRIPSDPLLEKKVGDKNVPLKATAKGT